MPTYKIPTASKRRSQTIARYIFSFFMLWVGIWGGIIFMLNRGYN